MFLLSHHGTRTCALSMSFPAHRKCDWFHVFTATIMKRPAPRSLPEKDRRFRVAYCLLSPSFIGQANRLPCPASSYISPHFLSSDLTDKWQTRPLVREGAPQEDKDSKSLCKTKNLVMSPRRGSTPRLTGWLTVSRNVTLTRATYSSIRWWWQQHLWNVGQFLRGCTVQHRWKLSSSLQFRMIASFKLCIIFVLYSLQPKRMATVLHKVKNNLNLYLTTSRTSDESCIFYCA
jgi:hypothetical protein